MQGQANGSSSAARIEREIFEPSFRAERDKRLSQNCGRIEFDKRVCEIDSFINVPSRENKRENANYMQTNGFAEFLTQHSRIKER